ncbi:MAG: HdeD family acid-resistance protein [Chlamydiales bacterium]
MHTLKQGYRYLLTEGIIFTLVGILCLLIPAVASYGFEIIFGVLLIILGLTQTFRIQQTRHLPGKTATIAGAALAILIGIGMLIFPTIGLMTLSLLASVFFFVDGIIKIVLAFQYSFMSRWFLYLINGLIEIILAFIVWSQWPISAFWFIGILIGVNFLFVGIIEILFALEVRHAD